jgi:hypothetical protein
MILQASSTGHQLCPPQSVAECFGDHRKLKQPPAFCAVDQLTAAQILAQPGSIMDNGVAGQVFKR